MTPKNLIFDLGGVLMMHDMRGCIDAFHALLGVESTSHVLGLLPNGEGAKDSLMDQFEHGYVSTEEFVHTLLLHAQPGTTHQDIVDVWNTMHAGIPSRLLDAVRHLGQAGHHLLVLSNNNELHVENILTHYDMSCFDRMFFSNQVHICKPEPQLFYEVQNYLNNRGWGDLETWFIDDIEANRLAAQSLHWHTVSNVDALIEALFHA